VNSNAGFLVWEPESRLEHNQDRKVGVGGRAITHLPRALALNKCARIENLRCVGESNPFNPCSADNIDGKSGHAWRPDIVPVGFDGVRHACEKIRRGTALC